LKKNSRTTAPIQTG